MNKFKNYEIVWFFNKIYEFDLYEDLSDFMKKNKFDTYFICGGESPLKNYVIMGKYKNNFKNLLIFLTKRRR